MMNIAGASNNSLNSILSEKEFIKFVEKSEYFKTYKKDILSKKPLVVKPVTDIEGNQIGYISQYEIEYNHEQVNKEKKFVGSDSHYVVKFTSLLVFLYKFEDGELIPLVLDYNYLDTNKEVYIVDLKENKIVETIDVSEDEATQDLLNNIDNNAEAKVDSIKKKYKEKKRDTTGELGTLSSYDQACWLCHTYETDGGEYSGACSAILGATCRWIGNNIYSKLFCSAGIVIGCYIPQYKYCVGGSWYTTCPTQ